jgi:hypothetical protein
MAAGQVDDGQSSVRQMHRDALVGVREETFIVGPAVGQTAAHDPGRMGPVDLLVRASNPAHG